MSAEHKRCCTCGEKKPLTEYTKLSTSSDGYQPRCRPCSTAASRMWRERNRDRARATMNRWGRGRKYGLMGHVGAELRFRPCDICGAEPESVIDHCHETGAVRGSLCQQCNKGLGHFRDSPELLARAIHYLTRGADYRAVDREDGSA